jgi:hypothetical protein
MPVIASTKNVRSPRDRFQFEDCDIVSPCAWGGVLTDETVSKIKGKIVCGAANSQVLEVIVGSNNCRFQPRRVCLKLSVLFLASQQQQKTARKLSAPRILMFDVSSQTHIASWQTLPQTMA